VAIFAIPNKKKKLFIASLADYDATWFIFWYELYRFLAKPIHPSVHQTPDSVGFVCCVEYSRNSA
jgi:hypothetical protein